MPSIVFLVRTSAHPLARLIRTTYRAVGNFSLPVPRLVLKPIVAGFLMGTRGVQWLWRVFVCEPYLKARCVSHGERIRTGCFLHYISGAGSLRLGDRVRMDGKSNIIFASILPELPELSIGDDSYINHNAMIVVARRIRIGSKVLIGPNVTLFDSPGHPIDSARRMSGEAPTPEEIKAISIEDGAWICSGATIFPGVTIGEESIVALGAIVTRSVPPRTLVAGSPARVIRQL